MSTIYFSTSIFMIILLTILFFRIWSYIDSCQSKNYALAFIFVVGLYIFMDALFVKCFLTKSRNVQTFKSIVFLFYLVYVTVPYIWHLFMQSYMGIQRRKITLFIEAVPYLVLLLLVLLSTSSNILWYIRHDGTYLRGKIFSIFSVLNLFYYVFAFIQTIGILLQNNAKGFRYLLKSSLFSAIPLLGILVNTYVIPLYGVYPFQPYCLVITALLAYLFMVEHQKYQLEAEHREMLSAALEHEKAASRKAREASAVKDTFLANMSHDIRTPMNAILGFSNMIARHPEDAELVKTSIQKILASGDILLKIINDVLDLSRIESGKLQIEETPTDLNELIRHLEMMLEYSIQKKQIHFEVINHIENPYVQCDATKLQQVLVNILNNAVKFTSEGGQIHLTYEQLSSSETSAEYMFSVKDNGIGMDEAFLSHAFEAFERERTSTESQTEGTGLGLAIVQKLVNLMNGNVTIQSKRGDGTEISIYLPLRIARPEELAADNTQDITDIDLSGMKALLVEDNELNAEIAIEILKNTGLHIDWVKDGIECLDQLETADSGYYQFILMDIQMPRLNGYDTTRRIRRLRDSVKADIPIIAMTANAFSDDQKKALDTGMNGFIAKPIDVNQMLHTIAEIQKRELSH